MSVIAKEKLNWLDQVKADAEKATLERIARELPQLEAEVKERAKSARKTVEAEVVEKPAKSEE